MNSIKTLLAENMQQLGMIESLSISTMCVSFLVSLVCAIMIYQVYRHFYKGVSFSENFGMLLILLTVVTTFIILCISSNLVLSLGMVGALSIVRFRAAVKEPLDVGFLFFAIAAGITAGARLYDVALVGTIIVCVIFVLSYVFVSSKKSYLLVIRYADEAGDDVMECLDGVKKKFKSKIKNGEVTELTYAVRCDEDLVDDLNKIQGVENVVLVQFTQEA
ncbi:MAG: DUF4956 domain-containing protein [Lachnospiraceae bacterium]|nr:DUF4956 domain-containing protein [Lachnospiraceae bacterium]